MILSTHGIVGSQITQFVGLLDTYSGAAAAYSLRRLSGAYSGSAIRVRKANDNTEENIGFDSNGNLDTAALTSFCSGTNGFVKTWYDQSGNGNNATQTTAANQPQIVSSGSVITENGKPSIQFDGSNDYLLSTNPVDPLLICCANKPSITTSYKGLFSADTSDAILNGAIYLSYGDPSRKIGFVRFTTSTPLEAYIPSPVANNIMNLVTGYRTNTTMELYVNNTSVGTGSTSSSLRPVGGVNNGNFTIGAAYYNNNIGDFINAEISEMIMYTSDQFSNISGINTNINDFYSIY